MSSYETFQLVAVLVLAMLFGLSAAARRCPRVTWLRGFANAFPLLPDEERRRVRKRSDFYAGVELIMLGVALPLVYAVLTMMTFSSVTMVASIVVGAGSVLCIGLGVTAIVRSRR